MPSLLLEIDNMHCGACVRTVTLALNALPTTHADEVKVGSALVSTEEPASAVLEAMSGAGFPARVTKQVP